MNLQTTADTRLYKFLAWQLTVSDRFLGNPLPGCKKNNSIFTTGLRQTFAR